MMSVELGSDQVEVVDADCGSDELMKHECECVNVVKSE